MYLYRITPENHKPSERPQFPVSENKSKSSYGIHRTQLRLQKTTLTFAIKTRKKVIFFNTEIYIVFLCVCVKNVNRENGLIKNKYKIKVLISRFLYVNITIDYSCLNFCFDFVFFLIFLKTIYQYFMIKIPATC